MQKRILSAFLTLGLCAGRLALALDPPALPPPALPPPAEEASRRIAAEAAAAIQALGAKPAKKQIAAIVFKAVRASSESVLPIVDATARVSPRLAVPEIVSVATIAVPNRWKKFSYRRVAAVNAGISAAGREGAASPGSTLPAVAAGPATEASAEGGIPMTLAEAIIRTAFDAQPGLFLPALEEAVNAALRMDPANLIRDIQDPRARSGVSGAPVSTYGNEPLLTPNQSAVSR